VRPAVAGAALALALVACGSDGSDGSGDGSAPEASTDPAELVGVVWVLDEATRGALAEEAPEASDITLEFADDGTVSGNAGCNTYSGSYEADDQGSMSFGQAAITQMACGEAVMALEANYLQTLGQVTAFAIAEGNLIMQAVNVQLTYGPQGS
jgi:heat shock protein HslJ